jgi:antitoxin MazE
MARVSRWGNSLAVRLPAALVDRLGLKDGDEVELSPADARRIMVAPDRQADEALERLRALKWALPPGFRFDREEANRRGGD